MARPKTPAAESLFSAQLLDWNDFVAELGLSPRQSAIVGLIFRGKKDKQIALELGISQHTVRTYVKRIFDRFDVSDRTELILKLVTLHRSTCPHDACPRK